MIHTTLIVLGAYALLVATWVMYLAVMNLKRHRAGMHWVAKAHAYPLVAVGLVFDAAVNVAIGTLLFADLPKEWLLTARLKRYHNARAANYEPRHAGTWRARLAGWICSHLLDQFDPSGDHC